MAVKIRPARKSDAKGFNACVGAVAEERRYIALTRRPPLTASKKWMAFVLGAKFPLLVAVDGKRIVGWCDVAPRDIPGFEHTGGLGMGLVAEFRGRGVGARLLKAVIARCRKRGIEKIELQVLASNRAARALYRKFGFRHEGRRIRARKLDGKYDDVILMGKLL
jgi:RimJ/RimL family protein N-acetyltransferase